MEHVRAFVASQVALHLKLTPIGTAKLKLRLDKLLPGGNMIHQKPAEISGQVSDSAVSVLSAILPRTFSCSNRACYRHAATFGELVLHSRLDSVTHALMGELVPECVMAFLKDVAILARQDSILSHEDRGHLRRLRLPIHFISGGKNRMFVPESTRRTYDLLCDANGPEHYTRTVHEGFGHLDCYFGKGAPELVWPDIVRALEPEERLS